MKKETWRTAFSASLALHTLLFFAAVQVGGFQRVTEPEPIEVELASPSGGAPRTDDTMKEKAPPRRKQAPLPVSRHDAARRDTKHAVPAAAAEPVHPASAPVRETLAKAAPETGSGTSSASGGIASKVSPASGHSDSGNAVTSAPAGVSGVSGNGGASGAATNRTAAILPYVIKGQPPAYPVDARSKGLVGKVRVKVLISEQGTVKDAFVASSSGHVSLDEAALKGLRRWLFHPAYREGRATTAWVVVPVSFRLD
jgi:periplasmic protein TonB